MIRIETFKVSLPLKKKFAIAGGEAGEKTNLITILNNRYSGEAAASVKYGPSVQRMQADLRQGVARLAQREKLSLEALQEISQFDVHPTVRSALTGMVLNYLSGESSRYPWEIVSLGAPVGIRNSITISIADPKQVIEEVNACDLPIVKVKMGGEHDAELVLALKDLRGKEIRVDANGGWTPEQAEEMIHHLAESGIHVIEQPTATEYIADWPHLKGKHQEVELIVDEGLNTLEDYRRLAPHCDGINIKMEKSGGIVEATRIARQARQDKKKIMLGCMVESSIGIAQSVYMSSLADYHDLDSPQLLEADIAQGIIYNRESIRVDREIIGGPSLKRDVVEKYIRE
ncbi:MAG: enolase C-terminal domain-like protein [Candidatus Zixiibacteriota bacterium]